MKDKQYLITKLKSYKDVLKSYLLGEGNRGALSKAATYLNCQKSYLSKVIKTEVHLSLDHGYLLCKLWSFDGDQREYFMTLLNFERAASLDYKNFLAGRLQELRSKLEATTEIPHRPVISGFSASDSAYFSSWHWNAIHFLTACPSYQSIPKIARKLQVEESFVEEVLKKLKEWNFVEGSGHKWTYKGGEFQLGEGNPFKVIHQNSWRQHAVSHCQQGLDNSIHFTNIQSISKQDFEWFRYELLRQLAQMRTVFNPSDSELVSVLCLDYYTL